jgi:hypothetical protein
MHPLPLYASVLHLLPSYRLKRVGSLVAAARLKRTSNIDAATLWVIPLPGYRLSDSGCDFKQFMAEWATVMV